MPIGFVCHGMHGAGSRKVFSSLAYKYIDVLIFNGFRQCSGTPYLSRYDFILCLCFGVVNTPYQEAMIFILLQAVHSPEPYLLHLQRSAFLPVLKGIGALVGLPY